MTFKIEKGIPIPPKAERGGNSAGRLGIYPWKEMEVGDSFFIPAKDRGDAKIIQLRVGSAAKNQWQNHGRVIVTRSLPGGIRVWRAE